MAKSKNKPPMHRCHVAGAHLPERQKLLRKIQSPTDAALVHEPHNRFDRNAIAVYVHGHQLGYVPKDIAAEIVSLVDTNGEWMVTVPFLKVRPPGEDYPLYGANMAIEPRRPDARYLRTHHMPSSIARKQFGADDGVKPLLLTVATGTSNVGRSTGRAASRSVGKAIPYLKRAIAGVGDGLMRMDGLLLKLSGGDGILHQVFRVCAIAGIVAVVVLLM